MVGRDLRARRNGGAAKLPRPSFIESNIITAKIVFHDPIPRGEYNLVVSTRCGDGRDYALRRIGHPVIGP